MDRTALEHYRKLYHKDLFEAVLPFWYEHGFDQKFGGIDTCLTREGKVFSAEKSVWMQGRGGWMFANICNVFGDDPRLHAMAESALKFSKEHCIDLADGRMYFVVGTDGTPVRKRRYVFSEYFYIMANAEFYGLTHDVKFLDEARRYHAFIAEICEDPSRDPYRITPKFLPTAPAMRGLCGDLVLMLVTRTLRVNDPEHTEEYKAFERKLLDGILKYQWNSDFGTLMESVGPNGEYIGNLSSGRMVTPGHCFESAWYLLREAEELDDPSLVARVEDIYKGAYHYGWDKTYGGFLYFVDVEGYAPQAYEHDMKLWWVHTEAILAALKLYRVTKKVQYWDDFVTLTDYAFEHFRDAEYGEWYGYLRRDGKHTEPAAKGNVFKGPFHVPRLYSEAVQELGRL